MDIEQAELHARLVSLLIFEHRVKPCPSVLNKRFIQWLRTLGALDDADTHFLINELNLKEA